MFLIQTIDFLALSIKMGTDIKNVLECIEYATELILLLRVLIFRDCASRTTYF